MFVVQSEFGVQGMTKQKFDVTVRSPNAKT